jgi:hypothetical protein
MQKRQDRVEIPGLRRSQAALWQREARFHWRLISQHDSAFYRIDVPSHSRKLRLIRDIRHVADEEDGQNADTPVLSAE